MPFSTGYKVAKMKSDLKILNLVMLKELDSEKTSLAKKVLQTLHCNDLVDGCSYLENCSIFGRKCQLADLIRNDVGFYLE